MTTPATWTAEDIPSYQFDGSDYRPHTDLDAAMSAPRVLVKETTERQARHELVIRLIQGRSYAERYGEALLYDAAIDAIERGANFVQIKGRGYRLRDELECDTVGDSIRPHALYQVCPNCLPASYLSITEAVRLPHTPPRSPRPFPGQRTTPTEE